MQIHDQTKASTLSQDLQGKLLELQVSQSIQPKQDPAPNPSHAAGQGEGQFLKAAELLAEVEPGAGQCLQNTVSKQ